MEMTDAEYETALEQMRKAGEEAGKNAASWLLDGNSTEEAAREVLRQVDECELDWPMPFSGEWADQPTVRDVIGQETDVDVDSLEPEVEDELASAFEDGYGQGYHDEAERSARAMIG